MKPLLLRMSAQLKGLVDSMDKNYTTVFYKTFNPDDYNEYFIIKITDNRTKEVLEINSFNYKDIEQLNSFDEVVLNFINRKTIVRQQRLSDIISSFEQE